MRIDLMLQAVYSSALVLCKMAQAMQHQHWLKLKLLDHQLASRAEEQQLQQAEDLLGSLLALFFRASGCFYRVLQLAAETSGPLQMQCSFLMKQAMQFSNAAADAPCGLSPEVVLGTTFLPLKGIGKGIKAIIQGLDDFMARPAPKQRAQSPADRDQHLAAAKAAIKAVENLVHAPSSSARPHPLDREWAKAMLQECSNLQACTASAEKEEEVEEEEEEEQKEAEDSGKGAACAKHAGARDPSRADDEGKQGSGMPVVQAGLEADADEEKGGSSSGTSSGERESPSLFHQSQPWLAASEATVDSPARDTGATQCTATSRYVPGLSQPRSSAQQALPPYVADSNDVAPITSQHQPRTTAAGNSDHGPRLLLSPLKRMACSGTSTASSFKLSRIG
jgi:hypothetical protein